MERRMIKFRQLFHCTKMDKMLRLAFLALIASIPIVVACGSSSTVPSSKTSVAGNTVASATTPQTLSKERYTSVFDAALLASEDLPPGWTAVQSAATADASYGDQLCTRIDAVGNSASVSWVKGKFQILSTSIYYYASGGASRVLSDNRTCTSAPWEAPAARGGVYQIKGLSVTSLGDESVGDQFETDDKTLGHVFAAGETIRHGDFVIALNVLSNAAIDASEIENLAAIADAKLSSALGGSKGTATVTH